MMMIVKTILFISISFFCNNLSIAQDDQLKLQVLQGMRDALVNYDTCHYRTQMRFKSMGEDSFDIRNFNLSFRANPDNLLYGYDWEFEEVRESGITDRWMFLPATMELVLSPDRKVFRGKADDQIHLGHYTEAMRWYFSLEKTFAPFIDALPEEIVFNEVDHGYFMDIRVNRDATRNLIVDKKTYLPELGINIITEEAVGFEQVQEIHFYFDDNCTVLPDSALNPEYFISKGFELVIKDEKGEAAKSKPARLDLTTEEHEMLVSYPFVNPAGDTITLSSEKGNYILLDFWYASCQPCLQAMPHVNAMMEMYSDKGLAVMGINCFDKEARQSITDKLQMKNITIPQLYGERELVNNLSISSYPTYILIMPDGRNRILNGGIFNVKEAIAGLFD